MTNNWKEIDEGNISRGYYTAVILHGECHVKKVLSLN